MSSIITSLLTLPLAPVLIPLRFIIFGLKTIVWPFLYAARFMFTSPRYFFKIIWYGPQLVMDILFSFDSLLEVLALVALIGIITGLVVHFTYVGICHTLNLRFPPTAYPRTIASSKRVAQKFGQNSNGSLRKRTGRTRTNGPESSTTNRRPNTSESPGYRVRSPLLPLISTHLTPQKQQSESYRAQMSALMAQRQDELLASHDPDEERRKIALWKRLQEEDAEKTLSPRSSQRMWKEGKQSGGRAGIEGTRHGGPEFGGGLSTGLSPPLSPSANLSRRIGGTRDGGGPVLGSTIVEEENESSSDF